MDQLNQLEHVKENEAGWKVRIHNLIADSYISRIKNVNESLRIIDEARKLSENHQYQDGITIANVYQGFYLMITGDFERALSISKLALSQFNQDDHRAYKSLALYTIGSVYYKSNNYHIGLEHLLQCLSIRKEIDDRLGQSQVLKAIGTIYEYFNDYESAEEVYEKCIELSKAIKDNLGESNACNPLSGIYLKRNKNEEALKIAERSIQLKEEVGDVRGLAFSYHAKAKVFFRAKDYAEAEKWFLKSVEFHLKTGEKLGAGMVATKLAEMYYLSKKYNLAKEQLDSAIKIGSAIDSKMVLYKSYYIHYLIAKEEKNDSAALNYLEIHLENKESVINTDTRSIIKSLKAMSEIEMLERETKIIKEKNKAIKKKNAELDTFVYRVSHDLRGPIASLLGLYNIAKYDLQDPLSGKYLDMYHEQILRLNDIILDLINLTRIKGWQAKTVKIDFDEIIKNIIKSFKYLPNFLKINFKIDIIEEINFYSDKSIITTIFQNLIENSIKYSRANVVPYVHINVRKDNIEGNLVIEVSDNGIGINSEYQDRIFEMFFRANDEMDGSGLGLYILKYAVDKLNGQINLQSEHGKGSTFSILLPNKHKI